MTNEEAKEIFLNRGYVNGLFDGDKWRQSIVVISKWLEEPCNDAVSLQAVISTIYDNKSDFKNDFAQGFFADKIRSLPPVTPQPKTEVFDKIRTEMEQEYLTKGHSLDYWDGIGKCLQIVDKYKAESEDKE